MEAIAYRSFAYDGCFVPFFWGYTFICMCEIFPFREYRHCYVIGTDDEAGSENVLNVYIKHICTASCTHLIFEGKSNMDKRFKIHGLSTIRRSTMKSML